MFVLNRIGLLVATIGLVLTGCGGPPPPAHTSVDTGPALSWETLDSFDFDVVVAEPGLTIPAKHLYEWMYFSRTAAVGGPVEDSVIGFFRDSALIDTLIGLTTPEFDLSKLWYRYRDYRRRVSAALRRVYWDQQVNSKISIDSQQVVDFYHEHPESFSLPEQVEVFHILSSPLGFRQGPDSALVDHYTREDLTRFSGEYIERLYQLLMYGEAFENVAFNYSHDVLSRENGGRLGWTTPEKYIDPFDSVAFSLKDGEFSRPYQDQDGWHLLYRTSYNPGGPQPLDTGWVYSRALQGVFDAEAGAMAATIMDSLHLETDIKSNERILTDTIIYEFDDSIWAAVVNGTDTIDVLELKGLEESFRRGYGVGNTTPQMRVSMIAQAALPVRVGQAAIHLGLDTLPEYRAIDERVWHESVKSYRISDIYAREAWEPSDSAIAAYYEANFDDYNPKNHIKAQQLIVKDPELANFLRDQIDLGLDLEYLAKYYGQEEGYDIEFEDLGLVKQGDVQSAMYFALKNTHAHRTTRVVETDRGYQVGKVLDRDYERPLGMVQSEIKSILVEAHRWERWADIRDKLFQKHRVRFPGSLPPFELSRLSERNHPRTLPKRVYGGSY